MSEELAVIEDRQLGMARPPDVVLAEAKKAADALQTVIKGKLKPVIFNKEQYIEFEDWQLLGKFYGITVKIISTSPVEFGEVRGFEAKAVAIDIRTGMEISAADAMCLNDEENWSTRTVYEYKDVLDDKGNKIWVNDNRAKNGKGYYKSERFKAGETAVPMFQLRSMAQTRAGAKAFRNILAWVVVLAGYKPTPAEEMIGKPDHSGEGNGKPPVPEPQEKKPEGEAKTEVKPTAFNPAGMIEMISKFDSQCGSCNDKIDKGAAIFFDKEAKKAYHRPPCYVPE